MGQGPHSVLRDGWVERLGELQGHILSVCERGVIWSGQEWPDEDQLCCDSGAQGDQALAYLGRGFLEDYGLQDFGRSVASVPLLLYSKVLLHLINVTAKGSGQIGERNKVKGAPGAPVCTPPKPGGLGG